MHENDEYDPVTEEELDLMRQKKDTRNLTTRRDKDLSTFREDHVIRTESFGSDTGRSEM